jgi:hypothetical protein
MLLAQGKQALCCRWAALVDLSVLADILFVLPSRKSIKL